MKPKAIIYCRVSSSKQKTEGSGLESQEHRCRQYAKLNSYKVVEVFRDDFSGGGDFWHRPAMRQLLAFLDENSGENYTIIFDDLKRFARDIEFHWKLRKELKQRSATPACLNFNFEETPEGEFIESVLASMGQLERKQNQRQVCQKMKARIEKGYWTFAAPLGLTYEKDKEHGKILVPKQPDAMYIKQALEGYANRTFITHKEVQEFLNEKLSRKVGNSFVCNSLNQKLYAGLIEYEPWGIPLKKGQHQALISLATFEKNQERLQGKVRHFERQDNREEFPLRGFVHCQDCARSLTASWSTGRKGIKYPYYHCQTPRCAGGVKKQDLESAFEKLLKTAKPRNGIIRLLEKSVQIIWTEKQQGKQSILDNIQTGIDRKEAKKADIIQCAIDASNMTMRKAYEQKADDIEQSIKQLKTKLVKNGAEVKVGTVCLRAKELLNNPVDTWINGDLKTRHIIQNLVFNGSIFFSKKTGLGTTENALLYKVFSDSHIDDSYLVDVIKNNWKHITGLFDIEEGD